MQVTPATLLISSFVIYRGRRLVRVTPGVCDEPSFHSLLRLRGGPFTASCFLVDMARTPHIGFSDHLPALQDLDFALRLAARGHRVHGSRSVQAMKYKRSDRTYTPAASAAARRQLLQEMKPFLDADPVAEAAHHLALLAALVRSGQPGAARQWLDGPAHAALPRHADLFRAAYRAGARIGDAAVTVSYSVYARPPTRRLRDALIGRGSCRWVR